MMNLAEYHHKAKRLADYLPWAALVGKGVVLNKDGSFQRTAKFRGPDLDSATPAELVATASRLNNALRRLGSGWAIFVEAQRNRANRYPRSEFPDPVSRLVDEERRAQFEGEPDQQSLPWSDSPGGRYAFREPLFPDLGVVAAGRRFGAQKAGFTKGAPIRVQIGVRL